MARGRKTMLLNRLCSGSLLTGIITGLILLSNSALAAGNLEIRHASGTLAGRIDASGEMRAPNGSLTGRISSGEVRAPNGSLLGRLSGDEIRGANGALLGRAHASGEVRNGGGSLIWRIGASGEIRKANGALAGRVSGYSPGDRMKIAAWLFFVDSL
ncbi:MAG: hypothetical protein GMKNLPBB_03166 [Myxococcota bacterium]|nr:hypothetical protein [Myxococcota bacterium]